jgi:hypothetical protein
MSEDYRPTEFVAALPAEVPAVPVAEDVPKNPLLTPELLRVLVHVASERKRQDLAFGEQNHRSGTDHKRFKTAAHNARAEYDIAKKEGRLTWTEVLREELYEALEEEDPAKLRRELVQVAAVAVAWIQCLDRRAERDGDVA